MVDFPDNDDRISLTTSDNIEDQIDDVREDLHKANRNINNIRNFFNTTGIANNQLFVYSDVTQRMEPGRHSGDVSSNHNEPNPATSDLTVIQRSTILGLQSSPHQVRYFETPDRHVARIIKYQIQGGLTSPVITTITPTIASNYARIMEINAVLNLNVGEQMIVIIENTTTATGTNISPAKIRWASGYQMETRNDDLLDFARDIFRRTVVIDNAKTYEFLLTKVNTRSTLLKIINIY